MQILDVTRYLEEIAPLRYQEPYDNAGLLIGEAHWTVKGVITCLDSTEEVVDEAIALDCNLIIAHHPIIFSGLKRLTSQTYLERTVIKAIKNDIAIYAIHTNLDNVLHNGVNQKIAQKLELTDVKILSQKEEPSIGSGVIGVLPTPLSHEAFVSFLKEKMELTCLKHTAFVGSEVRKVALCGGSGRFLLDVAMSTGADVFISSDFKYHEFFDANNKITVFDIGHYESEKFTIDLLQELITGKFSKFAACCTKVNTNPIKYK